MATDTAPDITSARRNYWQLPTFALGIAAAIAAWTAFPPAPTSPADQFAEDLARLKQALERRPINVAMLEELTPKVASAAGELPEFGSSEHYLIGTSYIALAEHQPDDAERWAIAARHLARVEPSQLPEAQDALRLAFRRAKAEAAMGSGDPKLLATLLASPPAGEDVDGERRRLLAYVCLRQEPKDLKRAAHELGQYLGGQTRRSPASLGSDWLRLAELHIELNEPDKARRCLTDIGPHASPLVQAMAKATLARLAAAENNWAEAVKLYEAALSSSVVSADQAGVMRYQVGFGYLRLQDPKSALPYLEQASRDPGPVALAANVRMAELALRDPAQRGARGPTIDRLETAVRTATSGSEFRNPYLSEGELRAAFEEAIQVCVNEADFPAAARAATSYASVAKAGREREKRAEVNAAWASALKPTPNGAVMAATKFREAAEDYAALAAVYPTSAGKADLLRRALTCYQQAADEKAANAVIDQITRTPGLPNEVVSAAWIEKADGLLAGNHFLEAVEALKKALATPSPSAATARVKLALAYLDRGRTLARTAATPPAQDEAKGMIEFGQRELALAANSAGDSPAERAAHEQALFELGKLLWSQGNVIDAEARFRQQEQAHPTGRLADQGHLFRGSCLLVLARGDHLGGRPPADAEGKLAEAAKLFENLSGSKDEYLRTQADLRLANTMLLQKKYSELPAVCEKLAARYSGKVQELILLSMRYHAENYADRKADAARTLSRMQESFSKLTAADFPGGMEEYTREYWQKQWFDPLKARAKP